MVVWKDRQIIREKDRSGCDLNVTLSVMQNQSINTKMKRGQMPLPYGWKLSWPGDLEMPVLSVLTMVVNYS